MRCILCNFTISDEAAAVQNLDACPQCGTRSTPLGEANDVTIKINWQELRELTLLPRAIEEAQVNIDRVPPPQRRDRDHHRPGHRRPPRKE